MNSICSGLCYLIAGAITGIISTMVLILLPLLAYADWKSTKQSRYYMKGHK